MTDPQQQPELSPLARLLLGFLQQHDDDRPLTAAEIAEQLGVSPCGGREWRRRRVRFLVSELRDSGERVCGANDGYWLARSDGEWHDYLEAVRQKARFRFVAARRMTDVSSHAATGQLHLFKEPAR